MGEWIKKHIHSSIHPFIQSSIPVKREFLINIIFLLLVNLLIKPFYIFGIDRTVQNTVEPGDYGLYFALFNFTYLFQIINDFGVQNFNNRNIAQHNQLLGKYFPSILMLKGLLAAIYLIVVFAFAMLSGYEALHYHLLIMIGLNQVLLSLVLFLRTNISGLGMYRLDSLLSVLDKLLLIGICSVLLWGAPFQGQFQIEWFVYAQTSSLGLTALVVFLLVNSRIERLQFRFKPQMLWLILKKSYPFALVVFLMTAYTRIDGVMIERMLANGRIEADYYASAYRLLDASNMFGFLFAGLLLPMFARMIKKGEALSDLLLFSFQFIWAGAVTLAISTFFVQEHIMILLYDTGNAYSGAILGYLMISFIAISGSYIYGTLLTANGSLMKMNIIFLGGVILNVVLNLMLIPREAALGAAIATCVTQFLVFLGQVLLAYRELKLRFVPQLVLRLFLFLTAVVGIGYLLSGLESWNWTVKFLLHISAGIGLAFLFKLLDVRKLLGIIGS